MINFLLSFINILFDILSVVILVRILLSWIRPDPNQAWVKFIVSISEPILAPFRLPIFRLGLIDFSPIIAILALSILEEVLTRIIIYFA